MNFSVIKFCHMLDFVRILNVQVSYFAFTLGGMQVLMGMGPRASSALELVSFHTVSKGFLGECGQRGGYFEMTNFHPKVPTTHLAVLIS